MLLLNRKHRNDKSHRRRESTTPLIPADQKHLPIGSSSHLSKPEILRRSMSIPSRFRITRSKSSTAHSSRTSQQGQSYQSSSRNGEEFGRQPSSLSGVVPDDRPITFVAADELQENPLRDSELPYNIQIALPPGLTSQDIHRRPPSEEDNVSEISVEDFERTEEDFEMDKKHELDESFLLNLSSCSTDDEEEDEEEEEVSKGQDMTTVLNRLQEDWGIGTSLEEIECKGSGDVIFRSKTTLHDSRRNNNKDTEKRQLSWTTHCLGDSTEVELFQKLDQSGDWPSMKNSL